MNDGNGVGERIKLSINKRAVPAVFVLFLHGA